MRIITQPIYSPTLGLDDRIASTMKNVRAAEKITNFRIANGEIRKDWGYVTYGSNQPLLGTSCSLSVYREYNSTLTPHCLTSKYIYEYETASDRWNVVGRGTLLDNCEDAWDAAANVICDVSTDEKRGANSASIAIAAAFGTGLAADEDISASDVTDDTYLHFWIKSNIATAAGDLQLGLSEQANGGEGATYARYNIPALTADTWQECDIDLSAPDDDNGGTYPDDLNAVASIYLYVATDNGAQTVLIDDVRTLQHYTGDQDDGWSTCVHNDDFFATNYDDLIQRRDSSSNDFVDMAGSSGYQGKDIHSFKEHLVLLNTYESANAIPVRVRWTISGALSFASGDWTGTTAGFTDLTETQGAIVKGKILGDELIIYKTDSIYAMSWIGGDSIYRFDLRVNGLGLLGQRAVVHSKGVHYFIGTDYNIYSYTGSSEPVAIGNGIVKTIASNINPEQEDRSVIILDEDYDEILVGIPIGSSLQPNKFYRYNYKENNWSTSERDFICVGQHQQYSSITYGTALGTYGSQILTYGETAAKTSAKILLVADSNGYVYKIDRTTVNLNGSAQSSYFETPDFVFANAQDRESGNVVSYSSTKKRILKIEVEAKGNDLEVWASDNSGISWFSPSDYNQSINSTYNIYKYDLDYSAEKIRLKFQNTTASSDVRIRFYSIEYIVGSKND